MELSVLTEKLKRCFEDAEERHVFLVGRDRQPFANPQDENARDKDIWSLVGPIDLGQDPSHFEIARQSLENVGNALAIAEPAEDHSDSDQSCGQELFILVCDPESHLGRDEKGKGPKASYKARDKDIWSLSSPFPPKTVIGTFGELPANEETDAKAPEKDGRRRRRRNESKKETATSRHLLISLQDSHLPADAVQ